VNKPIAIICGAMAVTALWILGAFLYYGMVYGNGNLEAGNYHRNRYWSDTNFVTGRIEKHWSAGGN
jgi:hypothetical protein